MPQADDLLNQIELTLGEDNPVVETPPLIEVVFQDTDRALEGDKFLRTSTVTSAPVLTLPIPSGGGTAATKLPNRSSGTAHTSTSIPGPANVPSRTRPGLGGAVRSSA